MAAPYRDKALEQGINEDKKVRIENYCSILGFLNLSILNRKNLLTA